MGIPYIAVRNNNIAEILDSIEIIGTTCGTAEKAYELVEDITRRIDAIRLKTESKSKPRVVISIGRTMGSGTLQDVYIAGKNTIYDELITAAGGVNCFDSEHVAYPVLSAEGILYLNPEIVIELAPEMEVRGLLLQDILSEWQSVREIDAVKHNRIYIKTDDYTVIPGPRFILFLEDLARLIHPEIVLDSK